MPLASSALLPSVPGTLPATHVVSSHSFILVGTDLKHTRRYQTKKSCGRSFGFPGRRRGGNGSVQKQPSPFPTQQPSPFPARPRAAHISPSIIRDSPEKPILPFLLYPGLGPSLRTTRSRPAPAPCLWPPRSPRLHRDRAAPRCSIGPRRSSAATAVSRCRRPGWSPPSSPPPLPPPPAGSGSP